MISIVAPYMATYLISIVNKYFKGALTVIQYDLHHIVSFLLWVLFAKYICHLSFAKKQERTKKKKNNIESLLFLLLLALSDIAFLWIINVMNLGTFVNLFYRNTQIPVSSALSLCLIIPIMEEIQFRYVGMGTLNKYGKIFSVVAMTAIFSLGHNFPNILIITVPALVISILYAITGRLIWPILLHAFHNSIVRSGIIELYQASIIWFVVSIICIIYIMFILSKRALFSKSFRREHYLTLKTEFQSNKNLYKKFFSSEGMIVFYLITIVNAVFLIIIK